MKKILLLTATVVLSCLLPSISSAQSNKSHNISEWNFGEVVHGEKIDMNKLKGKVVVVENWGVQ